MKRRDVLKTALAGAIALAAPRIVQGEGARTIVFAPHADLASLDPVWTTADITRNFSLAVAMTRSMATTLTSMFSRRWSRATRSAKTASSGI